MEYDEKAHKYTLSTGRRFYANHGRLSLSPAPYTDDAEVAEGYDGHVFMDAIPDPDGDTAPWTPAERVELANYVIELWTTWRDKVERSH